MMNCNVCEYNCILSSHFLRTVFFHILQFFPISFIYFVGPIISSVILFVNEKTLKNSLNEKFRECHPQLPPSLTVSKIRNIKKSALLNCMALSIEVSTIASGVIFFERLCLKGLITKANRRLTMAVSLLLSYKFNECVTSKYHSRLYAMLDFIDRDWKISRKEVFDAEFGAFVHLGFTLLIPYQHVALVCSRLLKLVYKTTKHYLGNDLMELYTQDLSALERDKDYERKQENVKLKKKKLERDDAESDDNNDSQQ